MPALDNDKVNSGAKSGPDLETRIRLILKDYVKEEESVENVISTLLKTYEASKANGERLAGVTDILIKGIPDLVVESMDPPDVVAKNAVLVLSNYKSMITKARKLLPDGAVDHPQIPLDVLVKKTVNRLNMERKCRKELETYVQELTLEGNKRAKKAAEDYKTFFDNARTMMTDVVLDEDVSPETQKLVEKFLTSISKKFNRTVIQNLNVSRSDDEQK